MLIFVHPLFFPATIDEVLKFCGKQRLAKSPQNPLHQISPVDNTTRQSFIVEVVFEVVDKGRRTVAKKDARI